MEISDYEWNRAIRHLDLCYLLVDNTYLIFSVENYGDLLKLSKRVSSGEHSIDLYNSIMSWSI